MDRIRTICLEHTSLDESDIEIIESMAKTLQFIADFCNADAFIDCITKNKEDAIVVASAKPRNIKSLYVGDAVGELAIRENEPAVIRTLQMGVPSRDIKGITQEQKKVKQSVEPIKNKNNKTIGVIILEKDITENLNEKKKIEILAEANEELTSQIQNSHNKEYREKNITYHIDDAILIFDENGVLRFKNPMAENLYKKLGYKEELIGMDFNNLSLYDTSFDKITSENSIAVKEVEVGEFTLQIKYIVQNNKVLNLVMLIRDITDVKEKERELILKSVAIKEIHHRVKNNLQTIASLLRLQSRRSKNEEFVNAINESINRILSIAVTHELLAKQGIDEVNIQEVINKIKTSMITVEKNDNLNLSINVIGDDFNLDSDKSTVVALIVNEIIQNCIKHAFKNKSNGNITVKVEKGNIYSSVSIIDDGIGFDVNAISKSSLGLMIVRSLVNDKLKGNLNICSNDKGTNVTFDFKN